MSTWMLASIVLACGLGMCGLACVATDPPGGLAALNVAGIVAVMLLVTLTEAFQRQSFIDLAVVLAPMSLGGGLAFVAFLQRRR